MSKWLKRIRAALGICLTWAAGWAVAGVLTGVASLLLPGLPWDSFFKVFDAPLPALALPGFIGGAIFSAVLIVAEGRRGFYGFPQRTEFQRLYLSIRDSPASLSGQLLTVRVSLIGRRNFY